MDNKQMDDGIYSSKSWSEKGTLILDGKKGVHHRTLTRKTSSTTLNHVYQFPEKRRKNNSDRDESTCLHISLAF